MWSTPRHGTFNALCSLNVCGSRKSSRANRSATTIAYFPSGVKYMLYGSVTGIGVPGVPVRASIGVSESPRSFVTYSVFKSHDGTTCWGSLPTAKWFTIAPVLGSISSTVFDSELGT